MLMSLAKAVVGLVASPVALVADLATLPSSAYDNRHPLGMTGQVLRAAKQNLENAIAPSGANDEGKP